MTYPKFHLQIESYLRTVKAINTASNITTYSLVVLTSAYELEGLCELQRQLCSAHMLVQDSILPTSGSPFRYFCGTCITLSNNQNNVKHLRIFAEASPDTIPDCCIEQDLHKEGTG